MKTTPLKLSPLPSIPETIKEVIYDMLNALAAYHAPEEGKTEKLKQVFLFSSWSRSIKLSSLINIHFFQCLGSIWVCLCVAERGEERAAAVPGSQDLCQILQDVGDDVYQQYRLTRQGSDFDSQSAFHINVRVLYMLCSICQDFCALHQLSKNAILGITIDKINTFYPDLENSEKKFSTSG